jgi:glutathione S-transferase
MPILHHHPLSAPSRYIRLVLAEHGETVDMHEVHPLVRNEELLALNPAGTLPVLADDNEAVISDATAIAEYLVETRGGRVGEESLLPDTALERAEARRLVAWFGQKMHNEVTRLLVTELLFKRISSPREGGGAPDSVAIRAGRNNIRYHIRYIGYLADRRDWLVGRRLSLADLAAAAEISCLDYMGEVPWEEDEAAKAWYARIKSRLSFRPILADRVKGVHPAPHYPDLDF